MFDVLVGKLRIPSTRPGAVRRTSLIERLARQVSRPIVSVVAPAGYGKTTLLAQWAERSGQAVARHQWDHAEAFARRARAHLGLAGIEDSYGVALTSAVLARAALHRGDVPAARGELGASSRGQAVARARELGLLEG